MLSTNKTNHSPDISFVGRSSRKVVMTLSLVFFLVSFTTIPTKIVFKSIVASVSGSSSLHDWKSEVTHVAATGTFQLKDKVINSITNAKIVIEVIDIKSTEGKIMDNKTWEAFKFKLYPTIVCTFSIAPVKIAANKSVLMTIPGTLVMAGVSRSVSLSASGLILANGDLELHVSKKLKMTDYGMVPPTAVLGTIKVGDEVEIDFKMILAR